MTQPDRTRAIAKMTADELRLIIEAHALWLRGETSGARADLSGANLSDANLIRVNLRGADLSDANLLGANLLDANLLGANLRDANLIRVNLRGANLRSADLIRANLSDANLRDADLRDANLRDADLSDADLRDANLSGADLRGADLSDADLLGATEIPIVESIDAKILEACTRPGCELNMGTWHDCETTHCRAGWAIVQAGAAGKALEDKIGTNAAAALIYSKSRPGMRVPSFFATKDDTMDDLKACAGVS
jgi:pentapeptide repeat protein